MVAQSLVPIHTPITPAQAAQSELFSAEGRVAVSPPKTEPGNRLIRREKKAIAEVPDSLDQAGSSDLWQSITSTASLARAGEALSQANRERAARQRSERREGEHADKIMQSTGLTGATRGLEVALIAVVLQMNAQFFAAVALVMQRMASDDRAMSVLRQVGIITYLVTSIPDMLSFFLAPRSVIMLLFPVAPVVVSGLAWMLVQRDAATFNSQHTMAISMSVAGILGCVLVGPSNTWILRSADEAAPSTIWDDSSGDWFFSRGSHRVLAYIIVVVLVMIYNAHEALHHKKLMNRGFFHQMSYLKLPCLAAMSLALQRMALGILTESVHVFHWQLLFSPFVMTTFCFAVVCMLSCVYHVSQAIIVSPPHLFMPLYYGISSVAQLLQSMVITREFREEPIDKIFLNFACMTITMVGILRLAVPLGHKKFSGLGKAADPMPEERQCEATCLTPIKFAEEDDSASNHVSLDDLRHFPDDHPTYSIQGFVNTLKVQFEGWHWQ
jgi:hypothetical protein